MKVVYNKWIPFSGFFAINLFGTLFIREKYRDVKISERTYTHEETHSEQMLDFVWGISKFQILGGIIFYLLYFIEWLFKLIISGFTFGKIKAYKSISFEQEAYNNELISDYPVIRKRFAWTQYIFKIVK